MFKRGVGVPFPETRTERVVPKTSTTSNKKSKHTYIEGRHPPSFLQSYAYGQVKSCTTFIRSHRRAILPGN